MHNPNDREVGRHVGQPLLGNGYVKLAVRPEPEAEEQVSQESHVQEDVDDEPSEDADDEEVPEGHHR